MEVEHGHRISWAKQSEERVVMGEYEQFKADPRFTPSTGTILADRRIAALETIEDGTHELVNRIAELEAEKAGCEEWGKSEARMKERAEAVIERLKYILDRIETSGQGEMLAQYACDWAERSA